MQGISSAGPNGSIRFASIDLDGARLPVYGAPGHFPRMSPGVDYGRIDRLEALAARVTGARFYYPG